MVPAMRCLPFQGHGSVGEMVRRRRGLLVSACRLTAVSVVALAALAAPAAAADTGSTDSTVDPSDAVVRLTTPYPALSVEPGADVKLDLEAHAPEPERVDLAVKDLPDGWKATLRGGGYVIAGLTAGPDTPGKAQIELTVPPSAASGDYPIEVTESAPDGTSSVQLTITVAPVVDNGIAVTADFPSLTGGPSDTFSYNLTIANNTPTQQAFNFAGTGPDGWTVTASPEAEARANTVTIDAGATSTVHVTATPPATVEEGTYPVQVDITGAAGGHGSIKLTAQVTGAAKLDVATADQRLNLSGNSDSTTTETFVVSNSGTAPLDKVSFSSTPPAGWDVKFEPDTLSNLAAGQTAQVVAVITPGKKALAGDYAISVIASGGSEHANLDLRYTVTTSRSWALVGIGVAVVGVIALALGYRRFGRR